MAREFDRQVAERHVRIDALNRFTNLETPKPIAALKS